MQNIHLSLGPKWTNEELDTFFHQYQQHRTNFSAIAQHLPLRTLEMIQALHAMHRGFLALSVASSDGLITIMEDHYNAIGLPSELDSPSGGTRKRKRSLKNQTDLWTPLHSRIGVHEWFYSSIDQPYFQYNEFQECLDQLGLGAATCRYTRTEWMAIRSSMGRPRRLSPQFIYEERIKLSNYRHAVRTMQYTQTTNVQHMYFPYATPRRVMQNAAVVVVHPSTRRLENGFISQIHATPTQTVYDVQLDNKYLGTTICQDTAVMLLDSGCFIAGATRRLEGTTHETEDEVEEVEDDVPELEEEEEVIVVPTKRRRGPRHGSPVVPARSPLVRPELVVSEDKLQLARLMAAAQRLLERKQRLLEALKHCNTTYNDMGDESEISVIQHQYSWLMVNLDVVNQTLKYLMPALDVYENGQNGPAQLYDLILKSPALSAIAGMKASGQHQWPASLEKEQLLWISQMISKQKQKNQEIVAKVATPELTEKIQERIIVCLSALTALRECREENRAPQVLDRVVIDALQALYPVHEANLDIYKELTSVMEMVKYFLILLK